MVNMESPEEVRTRATVAWTEAVRRFEPEEFGPAPSDSDTVGLIGQSRAVDALEFALTMHAHAALVGPVGTGKTTHALAAARTQATQEPTPPDRCYVPDVERPRARHLVEVPAGQGRAFELAVAKLVADGTAQVRAALESDSYQHRRQLLVHQYQDQQQQLWNQALAVAQSRGFTVEMTAAGPVVTIPLNVQGQPYSPQEFRQLPEATKNEFQARQRELEEPLSQMIRQVRAIQRAEADTLRQDAENMAQQTLAPILEALAAPFAASADAHRFMEAVAEHMAHHLDELLAEPPPAPVAVEPWNARYAVRVLVEHQARSGAPVILEANPTYKNLFGRLEYQTTADGPGAVGGFELGTLARAHGGYLIVPLADLLQDAAAYVGLKRALKLRSYRIEGPDLPFWGPITTLAADPLPVAVCVLLVGPPELYYLLWANDDEFRRLFTVKVEFQADMPTTPETLAAFRRFAEAASPQHTGMPLGEGALEALASFSAWLAEDQGRLSARLGEVGALLREAAVFSRRDHSPVIAGVHIEQAREARRERARGPEETTARLFHEGTLLIDTDGSVVGQVNGLAVLSTGDQSFGRPSRITAVTHVGRRGIANIERETRQSGATHTKGVLTLAGFFAGRFAQAHPLSFSASLAFEQLYGGIDGDSASSAELYALLSALADLPIDQGIAVTGSVNQRGEIQPIGGANEKVAGFFRVCRERGLTGRQGVLIPRRNVRNLMLDEDVLTAIRDQQFHLWAVDHVDDGITLLTGWPAGTPDSGSHTVMGRVMDRLLAYHEAARSSEPEPRE